MKEVYNGFRLLHWWIVPTTNSLRTFLENQGRQLLAFRSQRTRPMILSQWFAGSLNY